MKHMSQTFQLCIRPPVHQIGKPVDETHESNISIVHQAASASDRQACGWETWVKHFNCASGRQCIRCTCLCLIIIITCNSKKRTAEVQLKQYSQYLKLYFVNLSVTPSHPSPHEERLLVSSHLDTKVVMNSQNTLRKPDNTIFVKTTTDWCNTRLKPAKACLFGLYYWILSSLIHSLNIGLLWCDLMDTEVSEGSQSCIYYIYAALQSCYQKCILYWKIIFIIHKIFTVWCIHVCLIYITIRKGPYALK